MPTFDFTPQPVQMPNAVGNNMSSAPIQIREQARQNLSGAVDSLGASYQGMLKEQDDADMVATRSAVLRIKAQEDAELSSVANPADVKKIQESYKKQYDSIISGKEPLNGKPYFRNQSGKDKFNKGFMENFHTQRYVQGTQQTAELHKRDTKAKLINGIKSRIDQPNWNTQSAHDEIDEYVTKMYMAGDMTEQETINYRKDAHSDYDAERANKLFAWTESLPYGEDGEELKYSIDEYKKQVNTFDNLTQEEKNDYTSKADALFRQKKAVDVAEKKEFRVAQERAKNEYGFDKYRDFIEGKIPRSAILNDKNIPMTYRGKVLTQYASDIKDNKEAFTELNTRKIEMQNESGVRTMVMAYNPTFDDNRKKRFELISLIDKHVTDTSEQKQLTKFLTDGYGMDDQQRMRYDLHQKSLSDSLGLDVEINKDGKLVDRRKTGAKLKDGRVTIDDLDQYERAEANMIILNTYANMVKFGDPQKAEEYINGERAKVEKTKNDRIFYDNLMSRYLAREQYKDTK